MRFFLKIGLRNPTSKGGYVELLKAVNIGDVVVGDLVEINNQIYLYRGMNPHGGPGQALWAQMGYPTPEFGPPTPIKEDVITVFDLPSFPSWKKVGHRTPQEWKEMVDHILASA